MPTAEEQKEEGIESHDPNLASTLVPAHGERRVMRNDFSCMRWLYPLLAIVALMVLGQATGHAQGSRATGASMSRPQMLRTFAMPAFSPDPSVHIGMIPMLSTYGMAQPMQAGRMIPNSAAIPYGGSGNYGGSQGYMPGYGGSQGYIPGYQSSGEEAPAGSKGYTAEPQPDRQKPSSNSLLTASGVPNENGQLRWPLGLRILAAPQADQLREQIGALFQEATSQTVGGPVSSPLIQEMGEAVKKLRGLLLKDKDERFGMPLAVYNESERFLNQLQHAAQLFQAGLKGPGGQDGLQTAVPSTSSASPPRAQKQKGNMGRSASMIIISSRKR
jgi:hypothetical protein